MLVGPTCRLLLMSTWGLCTPASLVWRVPRRCSLPAEWEHSWGLSLLHLQLHGRPVNLPSLSPIWGSLQPSRGRFGQWQTECGFVDMSRPRAGEHVGGH